MQDLIRSQLPEEILLEYTSVQPEIPEMVKRRTISLAITRWLKYKKYSNSPHIVPSFKGALEVELRSLEKKQQPYNVLMLLNLASERFTPVSPLNVQGGQISFLKWIELGNLEVEQLWKKAQLQSVVSGCRVPIFVNNEYEINYRIFTPVLVSLDSYNVRDAVSVAVEKVDLFRAALNFVPATGLIMKFGRQSPICKFLASPIYGVFDSKGSFLADVYAADHYIYTRQERISEQEFNTALELVRKINAAQNGELVHLFVRLLYLYQQALDFANHRATFLALWQVLEMAVLDKPEERIRVDRRLVKLLGIENEPLLNAAIRILVRYRNSLVHSGVFPEVTENLVFALKSFVDAALFKVLNLSRNLSNEAEYELYLNHLTLNDVDLARRKEIIALIQSARGGS